MEPSANSQTSSTFLAMIEQNQLWFCNEHLKLSLSSLVESCLDEWRWCWWWSGGVTHAPLLSLGGVVNVIIALTAKVPFCVCVKESPLLKKDIDTYLHIVAVFACWSVWYIIFNSQQTVSGLLQQSWKTLSSETSSSKTTTAPGGRRPEPDWMNYVS